MTAEVMALAHGYCDGTLSAGDAARLSELLRDHPENQRAFLEVTAVHARLQAEFGPAAAPAPRPNRPLWRRAGLAAGLAASVAVVAALLAPRAAPVAVVAGVSDARQPDGTLLAPGTPLSPGRVRLDAGVAEIAFADGAVAVVEGPAELDLVGPHGAYLHAGQVVLRSPVGGHAFSLETPTARLSEHGTVCGVRVEAGGGTTLQVYDGEVVAATKGAGRPAAETLGIGRAVRLVESIEPAPFWPEQFVRVLPHKDDPAGRGVQPYNRAAFEAVRVVPAPGPVDVNGDLSDWDLSGRFHAACDPPYSESHAVDAAMMYDATHLYVSASVRDPFPMRSQISPAEKRELYGGGGGVALRLSVDRAAGWPLAACGRPTSRPMRPDDRIDTNEKLAFLMLWYHRPTAEACLQVRYGMDCHGGRVNPPGYRGVFREHPDGRGYTLEYALPWELLHAAADPPRAGDVLAATWLVHWADETGRVWKGQLIDVVNPRETGWNFERAATWGKALYAPAAPQRNLAP